MAVPRDHQAARNLVEKIAKDHGYLGEEKLGRMGPELADLRREIEEAFLKKDLLIGMTVITLSKNLYTSKARFVFELLQNADDNNYEKATASGAVPYVSFRVYPDKIVLECNEDGFTHENLASICSVGQSSKAKAGAQGYIGEKGIGFKSVFMVASKVHIQSGAFSFSFSHKNGDSGMGMISPIWEDEAEKLPDGPLTRITLHLHTTGGEDMLAKMRQGIHEQFEELQEKFLLFMKNLQRIYIAFYDEKEERLSSATYSVARPRPNYATLTKTKAIGDAMERVTTHFHVTKHTATNLAKNENRTYTENEEATRAYSRSQVILAFPLSETLTPIIEPQDLFVFLPVRPVEFKFLIQADFVTDASRQDIVKDSLRNLTLLDGIADAFAKAVLQFCQHSTLRYEWMRYLPDRNASNRDTLFASLVSKIADRLRNTPVLLGRNRPDLRLIRDVVRITTLMTDENGEPLFEDEESDQIISQRYSRKDLLLLDCYGLEVASFLQVARWLRQDLDRGLQSRMKSPETSENWHTRAAKLFHYPFVGRVGGIIEMLKRLPFLPLRDGTWVSASSGPVYFSQTDGMAIPPRVDLRLISEKVKNPDRRILFEYLGVKQAPIPLVRKKILQSYPKAVLEPPLSISTSRRHLEFLYLSEHLVSDEENPYSPLVILDQKREPYRPFGTKVYFINDDRYGPWELFRKTRPGPNPGDGAPGYSAIFLNEEYFSESLTKPRGQNLTWREWFHSKLNIRKMPTFQEGGYGFGMAATLSPEALYLQEHRPEKFWASLFFCIQIEKQLVSPSIVNTLRETEILCRGNRWSLLKNAYFPTEELEQRVRRFVDDGTFFPWIWLDPDVTPDSTHPKWKSLLAKLDVGSPPTDLDFALDMLRYSLDNFSQAIRPTSRIRLFELYSHISAKHDEADNRVVAREKIRNFFDAKRGIYIPLSEGRCTWAFPTECVWDAPQRLKSKYALTHLYGPDIDNEGLARFVHFFKSTIGIIECTWTIYIEELKTLKASGNEDIDVISGIYSALNALPAHILATNKNELRTAFESDALIYLPVQGNQSWHRVSRCVWSSAARLRGRVSLNDEYGNLAELFVNLLGVKPVDLLMAVDELKEVGNKQSASTQEVKESIWTVNSLLPTSSQPPSSQNLAISRIFPIRRPDGVITLGSKTTEFFIPDRDSSRRSFEAMIKFLDFTLEEVVRLRPFLKWMCLEDRYLSCRLKEITSFHGGVTTQTSNSNRQIGNRAHALLRIATHFNSPRNLENLYQQMKNAEIHETSGISSDLVLNQDGITHKVEGEKTNLHITEDDLGLKIYVPPSKDDQEYIFANKLPRALFVRIMTDPNTEISEDINKNGVDATRDILLAPRSMIGRALDDNGIAAVDIVNTDEEALSEPGSPTTQLTTDEEGSETIHPSRGVSSDTGVSDTPATSISSPYFDQRRAYASDRRHPSPFPSAARQFPFPAQTEAGNQQYAALLNKVIDLARMSSLPRIDAPPRSDLLSTGSATDWGLYAGSPFERDCKVGAAGELYVFELLSNLFLSRSGIGFPRSNWQSTMRKYVRVHPDYATMEGWTGRETSDIVCADSESTLTESLIEKGYLAREMWTGKKPTYFVEVKTTTLTCETRFFMSDGQYQRMQDNTISGENRDTIYVIFRVYNLGQDNMGIKIYVDPEMLRVSEELKFTSEGWTVVPR